MSMTLEEVFAVAMEFEKQGVEFYRKASQMTEHPFGKKMFLSLCGDEQRHFDTLLALAKQAGVEAPTALEATPEGPLDRARNIFQEVTTDLAETIGPSPDDIKAIDFALEVEKKSYDHYRAGAETTDDERVKKILLRIADEENEHYAILADTRLYLTNPTEWNLKEERPLIDGG